MVAARDRCWGAAPNKGQAFDKGHWAGKSPMVLGGPSGWGKFKDAREVLSAAP